MELPQAELLGWTYCVTDLLILWRDFMADFMVVFVGVGKLCSVRFLEWFGYLLLPLEEGPAGCPMGTFLWDSMILEGPFQIRIFYDFMILSCSWQQQFRVEQFEAPYPLLHRDFLASGQGVEDKNNSHPRLEKVIVE